MQQSIQYSTDSKTYSIFLFYFLCHTSVYFYISLMENCFNGSLCKRRAQICLPLTINTHTQFFFLNTYVHTRTQIYCVVPILQSKQFRPDRLSTLNLASHLKIDMHEWLQPIFPEQQKYNLSISEYINLRLQK